MPVGQPFTREDKEAICEMVSEKGVSLPTAASELGLSIRTVKRHLQDDAEFREMLADAEETALGRVEDVVYREAVDHQQAWAVKMWLTNRAPRGRWVDERDRGAGRGGPDVAIGTVIFGAVRETLTEGDTADRVADSLLGVPLPIEATATEVPA